MGKLKYPEIREMFKKSPVVSTQQITSRIKGGYAYIFLKNLVKQGKIKKLIKGFYAADDDPGLAVFCFKPSYLGLQDALSVRNLWEQETIPVIITTRKVRQGVRKIGGHNILIHRISPKYFFGFEFVKHGNFYFPVSDIEKTLIDLIYFNQNIDRQLLRQLKKKINLKKFHSYLKKYPKAFQKRVLRSIQNAY